MRASVVHDQRRVDEDECVGRCVPIEPGDDLVDADCPAGRHDSASLVQHHDAGLVRLGFLRPSEKSAWRNWAHGWAVNSLAVSRPTSSSHGAALYPVRLRDLPHELPRSGWGSVASVQPGKAL